MSGYVALANEFKKRNNIKILGPIVGRVMSELPDLKVSILNGEILLNPEQIYITDTAFIGNHDISLSGNMKINEVLQAISGDVSMIVEPLKKGDYILLLPSSSGQDFFVIDRVRKVR